MLKIHKSEYDCQVRPRPYCDVMLNRNTWFMSLDFKLGLGSGWSFLYLLSSEYEWSGWIWVIVQVIPLQLLWAFRRATHWYSIICTTGISETSTKVAEGRSPPFDIQSMDKHAWHTGVGSWCDGFYLYSLGWQVWPCAVCLDCGYWSLNSTFGIIWCTLFTSQMVLALGHWYHRLAVKYVAILSSCLFFVWPVLRCLNAKTLWMNSTMTPIYFYFFFQPGLEVKAST